MRRALLMLAGLLWAASAAWAQDPVAADPKHYKVVFENDQVRVLRSKYGPHEEGVEHDRSAGVVVFLTDSHAKLTEDGKSRDAKSKAGTARWVDAGKVQVENLSDKPSDVILIELKGQPSAQ